MKTLRPRMLGAVLWLVAAAAAPAQSLQRESILDKQEKQQRVRAMARELVTGIVDLQIRQLEENGMEKGDLYRELRSMRANLDKLIEAEMPRVVELLMKLQAEAGDTRSTTFLAARQKSREVLIQLLIERQNLLRRLRVAEMAAQVRQIIELQRKVLKLTQGLPELAQAKRDEVTLSTAQDQRDVKELYLRLKDLLKEVAGWGGPVGAEATKGMEILTGRKVDD
ncbi:MAG: hypothetical protein NUV77_05570, partial [Thermoguttaceae bacterium]|nr:hypothetical protein [Thermoguttaceae bacterium]